MWVTECHCSCCRITMGESQTTREARSQRAVCPCQVQLELIYKCFPQGIERLHLYCQMAKWPCGLSVSSIDGRVLTRSFEQRIWSFHNTANSKHSNSSMSIIIMRHLLHAETYRYVKHLAPPDFQSFVCPAAGVRFHCHSGPVFSGDSIGRNSARETETEREDN